MGRRIAWGMICLYLLISLAQAQAERCTTETLQGRYVFTGRGFIEPGEPGIQRVHYGIFVFDGTGKFWGKQSSSRGGKIGREKLQGAYTLDPRRFAPCLFGRLMPPARRVYTHDTELEVLTGVMEFRRDAGGWPIARNDGGDF
jgi:hypothetical protein